MKNKLKNCFCFTSQEDQEAKIRYVCPLKIYFLSLFWGLIRWSFITMNCTIDWVIWFQFLWSPQKSIDYPWNMYTLKELVHATNNFHNDNKIGEGGFGSVYWGRTSKGAEAIFHPFFFVTYFWIMIIRRTILFYYMQ